MKLVNYWNVAGREVTFALQKMTRIGFDSDFELSLSHQANGFLNAEPSKRTALPAVHLESLETGNHERFGVFREDIYRRFVVDGEGSDIDHFGRRGRWIPRGTVVYYDRLEKTFVKVFDEYASVRGEARFLPAALDKGLYDFLCPGLSYVIVDGDDVLRGYAIREGEPLNKYEFKRFVGVALREVILAETARTGLYFNDLTYHNVVRRGDRLTLIDLESVLPVSWFETDLEFARQHLDEIDLG